MATNEPTDSVPPIEPTPQVAAPAASVPPPPIVPAAPVAPAYPAAPAAPAAQYPPATDPYAGQPYSTTPAAVPYGYGQPGQPGQAPYGYYQAAPTGPRGLSIASMILGIVGVLFGTIYGLGLFPAIAGIITGHISLKRQPAGRGFSIAGLVCGYVGLLLSLIGIAFLIFLIVVIANNGAFSNFGTDSYGSNIGNS